MVVIVVVREKGKNGSVGSWTEGWGWSSWLKQFNIGSLEER